MISETDLREGRYAVLAGAMAVLAPLVVVVALAVVTTVGSGAPLLATIGTSSGLWLLSAGSRLVAQGPAISLIPLGIFALNLWAARSAMRRAFDAAHHEQRGAVWGQRLWTRQLPGFFGGYLFAVILVSLATLAGPLRPVWWSLPLTLGVPVLASAMDLWKRYGQGQLPPQVSAQLDRLPLWFVRALRPAWQGVGLLMAGGAVLVVIMLVLRWQTVSGLAAVTGGGLLGGLVLTLMQTAYLPNVAIWSVGWFAGPGFTVGEGTSISLSGSQPGLLPMIPIFGALPAEGSYPGWLIVVMFVPVLVGGLMAWRVLGSLARLSHWQTRVYAAVSTAALATLLLAVAGLLASGALGDSRLAHLGVAVLPVAVACGIELLIGALTYAAIDLVRRRR